MCCTSGHVRVLMDPRTSTSLPSWSKSESPLNSGHIPAPDTSAELMHDGNQVSPASAQDAHGIKLLCVKYGAPQACMGA